MLRPEDSNRFSINLVGDRGAILDQAVSHANQGNLLKSWAQTKIKGRKCISIQGLNDHLLLRACASFIGRYQKIRANNRNRVIRGIIEATRDGKSQWIVRTDIADFYKTAPIWNCVDSLINDTAIPKIFRETIKQLFDEVHGNRYVGLPPGIGLSALLAEICLQDFDRAVRSLDNVSVYYRYVDDIIIFCNSEPDETINKVQNILPGKMNLNSIKTIPVQLKSETKNLKMDEEFEYLGYKILINSGESKNQGRKIYLGISERTVKRIKSKIFLSLVDFTKNKDSILLIKRIQFLTSNYQIKRKGINKQKFNNYIKAGIFYSNIHCGLYDSGYGYQPPDQSSINEIKELDGFLKFILFSKNSKYKIIVKNQLNINQYNFLNSLSFWKGFQNQYFVKFTSKEARDIKKVWLNVI